MTEYSLYVCDPGQLVLYGVLFIIKGLIQIIALDLAYRTRKVKVQGLNDSESIIIATYVSSGVLVVIVLATYLLHHYVNLYPAVVGASLLVGTTVILVLVFVTRVSIIIILETYIH